MVEKDSRQPASAPTAIKTQGQQARDVRRKAAELRRTLESCCAM